MRAERFEDLVAWQKARLLAGASYEITRSRDFSHDYALARQMQRAAVSIMSNVAEGFGRAGRVEFHRFVTIARGSCFELLSQVYLATDIGYIHPQEFERLRAMIEEVSKIPAPCERVSRNSANSPQAPKRLSA